VIVPRTRSTFFGLLLAVTIGLGYGAPLQLHGQEKQEFSSIPDQFFQVQDSFGFFWRASTNGALTSGETQYLQSGLNLIVDGSVFVPSRGEQTAPGEDSGEATLYLREKREGIEIYRELWFDKERGGVRVTDRIKNNSGEVKTLKVQLRTTYPFGWKSLHGSGGGQLNAEPALGLAENDGGVSIRFGPSEGRPDTLILTSDGGSNHQPSIEASTNRRELTLSYEMDLKPGETGALLHWVLQRSLAETTETAEALSNFWQRGKLIRPGVNSDLASEFRNFGTDAFPTEMVAPSRLRSLIALNELIDRVGIHRRNEELFWISTVNQIAGTVDAGSSFMFNATHVGEVDVSLSKVAAIKGGGGFGRTQMVFLRDGTVLSGEDNVEQLKLSIGDMEAQAIDFTTLNLLLFRTEKSDGVPPHNTKAFVELRDGSVMAVSGTVDLVVKGYTAWGDVEIPFSEIEEAGYEVSPSMGLMIRLKNGSRLHVFLQDMPWALTLASGEVVEVSPLELRRLWLSNAEGFGGSEGSSEWLELSEVPGSVPVSAFLLAGNNVVAGAFKNSTISLKVEGTSMILPVEQIVRMKRSIGEDSERDPEFAVSLVSGYAVVGELMDAFVEIDSGEVRRVPVQHLLDFQRKESRSEQ